MLDNNLFGKIAPGMCRLSVNGNIAVKTSTGYKSYNVKTGKLMNCSHFAIDIGQDFFFVIPTTKAQKGDIILVNGKPRVVISLGKNLIKTFCYETSEITDIVPEHHLFLGKKYVYGKIVSIFGNSIGSKNNNVFKYMMLASMMNGNNNSGNSNMFGNMGNMSGMFPFMMMSGNGGDLFSGMFDSDNDSDEDEDEDNSDEENLVEK